MHRYTPSCLLPFCCNFCQPRNPSVECSVTSSAVFLVCECQAPAFDTRHLLIMAGDIEVNPGPKSGARISCDGCNATIRSTHVATALRCSMQGCNARCHQTPKCSKIGRYRSKDQWKCSVHSSTTEPTNQFPQPPPSTSTEPPPSAEKRSCGRKGCRINIRTNPFQCHTCHRFFHQSCTGITSRAVCE